MSVFDNITAPAIHQYGICQAIALDWKSGATAPGTSLRAIVRHRACRVRGKVEKFYDYPGQDFMAVIHKGKEILIPVNDDIIKEVNRDEEHLEVILPEGLLDIYL